MQPWTAGAVGAVGILGSVALSIAFVIFTPEVGVIVASRLLCLLPRWLEYASGRVAQQVSIELDTAVGDMVQTVLPSNHTTDSPVMPPGSGFCLVTLIAFLMVGRVGLAAPADST